jgi:rhodanese-related sulfurtransferase
MRIQAKQLNQDLQSGKRVSLIDVRTPVEHDEMHIAGSQLQPLDRLDPAVVKAAAENAEKCILICHSGKRAEQAFQILQAAGCDNLQILDGGVLAWESAALPLNRSEKKRLPLMRQVQLIIGLFVLAGAILALTVDKNFALIPAIFGAGMAIAGSTGWCGLAVMLSRMPWNKVECGGRAVTSCSI